MLFRTPLAIRRRFVPVLEALEGRWTPATASYNAVTQQLTIIADTNDTITVSQRPDKPIGFLRVNDGASNVFDGLRFVRHLSIDLRNDLTSVFTIAAGTNIAGNVRVFGGATSGNATLDTNVKIGGSFSYFDSASSADTVTINQGCVVAGAVNLFAGDGTNNISLKGVHYGSLNVNGGDGTDTVTVFSLIVAGNTTFVLGNGANTLSVSAGSSFHVGGTLTYTGGGGTDTVDDTAAVQLNVGGPVVLTLGSATGGDNINTLKLDHLRTTSSVTLFGGTNNDSVTIADDVFIGGDLFLSLRAGDNNATIGSGSPGPVVGRSFTYLGGTGEDLVTLKALQVAGNLGASLGNDLSGTGQKLVIDGASIHGAVSLYGGRHDDDIQILNNSLIVTSLRIVTGDAGTDKVLLENSLVSGAVTIITGAGADTVTLTGATLQGTLFIFTGAGSDTVNIDNTEVQGATTISTGAGADLIRLEEVPDAIRTTFGGPVTFLGGVGVDTLRIGQGGDQVRFGGRVRFNGGVEIDPFLLSNATFEAGSTGTW